MRKVGRRTAHTGCITELLTLADIWSSTLCVTTCISPQNCSSEGWGAGTLTPHQLWIFPRDINHAAFVDLPYLQFDQVSEAWEKGLRQKIERPVGHSGCDAISLHKNCPFLLQVTSEVSEEDTLPTIRSVYFVFLHRTIEPQLNKFYCNIIFSMNCLVKLMLQEAYLSLGVGQCCHTHLEAQINANWKLWREICNLPRSSPAWQGQAALSGAKRGDGSFELALHLFPQLFQIILISFLQLLLQNSHSIFIYVVIDEDIQVLET